MARIVVLQEIQANLSRVRRSLEPVGHLVIGFSSQPVAIAYLKDEKVDLIISAVHLYEGNVFDFLKWSRSHPTNRLTPFIFFCAEPTEFGKHVFGAVKTAGELLGASKYILMDTFDSIKFRWEIAEVLSFSQPGRESAQEQGLNLGPGVKAPQDARHQVNPCWQIQNFSVTDADETKDTNDRRSDGASRTMPGKEYQDQN